MSRPLAGPRLSRVLALVPFVLAHPGTTIEELARRFQVSRREIERDLELLPMCGLPPYTADRLIDVWVAEDGAVDIRLAEYFERPLRLTAAEGVALVAAARALLAVPGADRNGPLATAIEKLEAVVGARGRLAVDVAGAAHLEDIRAAADRAERIEIVYYSFSRDEMTTRRVDPVRVFHALGAWYLDAYCHRAGADRLFRVDRVQAVRPTGETFDPRPPILPERADVGGNLAGLVYHPRPQDPRVTIQVSAAASWVADELPLEARDQVPGDGVRIVLPVSEHAFLERLLLRLGPEAEVLDPPFARELRSAAARRVLARYADEGG